MPEIRLIPLTQDDRAQFIRDTQEAFNYGALENQFSGGMIRFEKRIGQQ